MIRFDSVSKVFANGYIGLEDVSFEVQPGSLTYIVGESGAGKTTLMRLLIREMEPTQGEIYLGKQSITRLPGRHIPLLRRRVGVVFQDYKLLPDKNVYENIAFILEIAGVPRREVRSQVEKVLDLVGLEDRQDLFPVQLSGGESQRISIARALALAPEVLFADEPTGNLDPKTSEDIGELLHRIAGLGTTVLISTHDRGLLDTFKAPQIHISQGKIIKDTTPRSEESDQDGDELEEDEDLEQKKHSTSKQKQSNRKKKSSKDDGKLSKKKTAQSPDADSDDTDDADEGDED